MPAPGCERWVESLGFPKAGEGWRPWMAGGIVAGGVIEYDSPGPRGSMEYATVHGAGHGVPQHRPQAALAMLASVLAGEPLEAAPRRRPRL